MAEAKNNFLQGRMNKDVDERLLQNGEYRDARNVSTSSSETGNSGSIENVLGTIEVSDFGLTDIGLECIGKLEDTEKNRVYMWLTNYTDSSATTLDNFAYFSSKHYIVCYDASIDVFYILVTGNFLNLSKTHRIEKPVLIEDLLFWNDDRNQPRKINVETAIANSNQVDTNPYYSKEEHISVAKYYPYNSIRLFEYDSNGKLNTYNHDLAPRITEVFDTAVLAASTTYPMSIPSALVSTSGSGTGATFDVITDGAGNVDQILITDGGSGFADGDTITFLDPTTLTVDEMEVTLTQQDLWIEPSMKDTTNMNLSYFIECSGNNWAGGGSGASGSVTRDESILNPIKCIGCYIYVLDSTGAVRIPISDGITLTNAVSGGGDVFTLTLSSAITLANDETIVLGANPYFSEEDSNTISNIRDKFVRFAYRFKYDDNEYSLISPFTQPAFIPKQDGHFTGNGDEFNKDEIETVKSSTVSFFENKVTEVGINIDLPEGISSVSELVTELKVKEVDILYKDANEQSVKVVKTIKEDDLLVDESSVLKYTYNSSKPTKVIPERDILRVSDIVPVRAKAQESISNRIVYANYLRAYAGLDTLNFSATYGDKGYQHEYIDSFSRREYPNHTLKQNRAYQVAVILVDKFGRKSDPIISENSTIFSKYPDASFNMISSTDVYMGDAIRIIFNQEIPENTSNPFYVGLYSEENPMGWYSYQIVVKQKEQSYYNVYAPTLLNGYPKTASDPDGSIAHITLVGDNINKVPRDLDQTADLDQVFRSDTQLYPRIVNIGETTDNDTYLYTGDFSPNKVSLIGYRDDMGLDKQEDGTAYTESPFFSIPDVASVGSNPLIGRVSTRERIGVEGGAAGIADSVAHDDYSLNILETRPVESNIELFWETSTSGLISELNEELLVPENAAGIPFTVEEYDFTLDETTTAGTIVTSEFSIIDFFGTEINNANTTAKIVSVKNKRGFKYPAKFDVEKNGVNNKFYLRYQGNPTEYYTVDSYIDNTYDITIEFTNLIDGETISRRLVLENNALKNTSPTYTGFVDTTQAVSLRKFSKPDRPNKGESIFQWKEVADVTVTNGSIFSGYQLNELEYEVNKVEWYDSDAGLWRDFWYETFWRWDSYRYFRLYSRNTNGLIKFIITDYPTSKMTMMYSPILQWGWHDRAPIPITTNLESEYSGETAFIHANYNFSNSFAPDQLGETRIGSKMYFTEDKFLLTAAYNKSQSIPANGLPETDKLYVRDAFRPSYGARINSFRNLESQVELLTDMPVRVTFTLFDAFKNGISAQFTQEFKLTYAGYPKFDDLAI